MNSHHPLCYNDEWVDPDCELCQVIDYIVAKMIPECNCGSAFGDYMTHHIGCRHGSFFHSQFARGTLR